MVVLLFSFIIPVYNTGRYLYPCLNSILSQDCTDYEVVLAIDTRSDLNSREVCKSFETEHSNIHCIENAGEGVSAVRNAAMNYATGIYLLFVDSDDTVCANSLTDLATSLRRADYPDYCFLQACSILPDGSTAPVISYVTSEQVTSKSHAEVLHLMTHSHGFHGAMWCKCVLRSLFILHNMQFDTSLKTNEDTLLSLSVFLRAKTYTASRYTYVYRSSREGSLTEKVSVESASDKLYTLRAWIFTLHSLREDYQISFVQSQIAYHACILLTEWMVLSRESQLFYKNDLRKCFEFAKYSPDKRVKIVAAITKVFGFTFASHIVRLYQALINIRRR